MERIFKNALKKQLRKRIKGTISVHVTNDTLIIEIFDNIHRPWRYAIYNLSVKLSRGLSSSSLSDVIVKDYKKYVFNQYFIY